MAYLAVLPLVVAMALSAGCAVFGPVDDDRFLCGLNDGPAPRRCDGPGEVCLCQEHRCAVPTGECDSGYRYRFPDLSYDPDGGDCVAPSSLTPSLPVDYPSDYCPGEDPAATVTCGGPAVDGGFVACPGQQICVCGGIRRCAVLDPSCGQGQAGLRLVQTWTCLGEAGLIDGGIEQARDDHSCPGYRYDDVFPDAGTDAGVDAGEDGGP